MKTSRIDLIALNGATGEHYKYEEVAEKLLDHFLNMYPMDYDNYFMVDEIAKILVENFPDE